MTFLEKNYEPIWFVSSFPIFSILGFCEKNNENIKWKQEIGFYYFHYFFHKILKTKNTGMKMKNENTNQTDSVILCLKISRCNIRP